MRGLSLPYRVLIVVSIGTFMVVLDSTIVNIALPKISAVFSASTDQVDIVLTGYTLALAIMMPATGFLSARFGLRWAYAGSLAAFALGSALCGLAQNVEMLAVSRVLQGLGGGMIQPLSMATLFAVTPERERGTMTGLYGLSLMVAPILGPTLGGYLVELVNWRWVFYVNVPVAVLGVLLSLVLLPKTPRRPAGFDWPGFVLAAACTSSALLAATYAPNAAYTGWTDPRILGLLGVAAATLPLFVWWELRAPEPLLNVRLFANLRYSLGLAVLLIATAALFGGLFLLPVFLQNPSLRGLGALEAGLLLFPQAFGTAPMMVLAGRLMDRIGPRPLLVAGLAILAGASWQLVGLDLTTSDTTLQLLLILRGAGLGLALMPAQTAVLSAVPPSQTQAASTFSNVLRQVDGSFSTALMTSLLSSRQDFHYATLAMFVRWESPGVAEMLQQAQQTAAAHGQSLAAARETVLSQLYAQVQQAATVKSFDDCFLVVAVACALAILPALLLKRTASGSAAGPIEV